VQSLALRVAVTALTAATAVAAAVHVSGNIKNASAPLHPGVVGGAAAAAPAGRLSLSPSVHSGAARPVTSTYAS
jgi:hypothetical protein